GTKKVIRAGACRPKPQRGIAAGNNVLFQAKLGDKKAMDYVLRGHDQLDVAVHRDVHCVNLALSFDVLQLPHPLLAYNIDFSGIAWWRAHLDVQDSAPGETTDNYA